MAEGKKFVLRKDQISRLLIDNLPLIGLLLIVVIFYFLTDGMLLTERNVKSLVNQSFLLMIACVGSIFIFLQGGVDLSMTNGVGMCTIIGSFALNAGGLWACILAMLATGIILGLFNGVIYAKTHINAFILTLAVNLILDGLNYTITDQRAVIQISRDYQKIFGGLGFKIGVLIVFSLIIYYFYAFTTVGKQSRAVGAGSEASRQSGIRVQWVKVLAFVFTGITCAVYGFMTMTKAAGGGPTSGASVGFNVMNAMILGGTTMDGGLAAKFKSCFIGSLIVTVLTNALSMIGVEAMFQEVIKGVIFVAVVVLTTRANDKAEGHRFVVRKKVKKAV